MPVPFIDLNPQMKAVDSAIFSAVKKVLKSRHYILGENVAALEKAVAEKTGAKYAFGVASGSDALSLSLTACGVKEGDEVITTPFTFFATAGMISRIGAKPVFVDVDADTFNLDPAKIKAAINKKTKAIIPVSLYGLCADLDPILNIARENGLSVIEDAAQSFGAKYKGKWSGAIADTGCYSFYPTKNFGGCGDGGMIVTSSEKIAGQIKLLRDYGSKKKYFHEIVGVNSRLDEIQAAILLVKLRKIDAWTRERQKIASTYNKSLKGLPVKTPVVPDGLDHVYHLYTLQVERRDELAEYLKSKGISTGIYYPLALHLQNCYQALGYSKNSLPVAEKLGEKILSLPMYNGLSLKVVSEVARSVQAFYA